LLWSFVGATFMKVNVNLNVYFHSVALGTTQCLALFRYVVVAFPLRAQYWLRRSTALFWLVGVIIVQGGLSRQSYH
jgi:hypothetical protein